jgi:hypothetical protein
MIWIISPSQSLTNEIPEGFLTMASDFEPPAPFGTLPTSPRSVCPELDNSLFNLEFMPLTLNQKKSAKIGQRQIDLAKRWNTDGLLSDAGLGAVLRISRTSR